jgi:hypothetical protein
MALAGGDSFLEIPVDVSHTQKRVERDKARYVPQLKREEERGGGDAGGLFEQTCLPRAFTLATLVIPCTRIDR